MSNNNDILQFYAFSANKLAGKGCGEYVETLENYNQLNGIHNWRQMFSSLWDKEPFVYHNLLFKSHEHAYQASKYLYTGHYDYGYMFSLDSHSELSNMDPKWIKKKKLMRLSTDEWNMFQSHIDSIKNDIYRAKFTKTSIAGKALMQTKNAQLFNYGPRIKKIRNIRLEKIRDELLHE